MSLISQEVPNLFGGVSQQPPSLRHPSQCEAMDNFYPEIATGLRKRPPLVHVAKLVSTTGAAHHYHLINRDYAEKYVVQMDGSTLRVWDHNGYPKTVNFPDGQAYLTAYTPNAELEAVTVADYTFILNKRVVPTISGNNYATNSIPFAMATFEGLAPSPENYGVTYTLTMNGLVRSCRLLAQVDYDWWLNNGQPGSQAAVSLTAVVANLRWQLAPYFGGGGWVIQQHGYSIIAYVPPGSSLTVSAEVSINGVPYPTYSTTTTGTTTGIGTVTGIKQRYADLPTSGMSVGHIYQITGDPSNAFDGFWVRWNGSVWVETTQPGLTTGIDNKTMPHALIREADGTFTFKPIAWDSRKVGDNASNPLPSFIGKPIRDIFFFRNRLGFLADEKVILSKLGSYYDFWSSTVTAVLDTDVIDVGVPHTKVSVLNHAVPFNKSLLVFSLETQFQLTGGDVLTPKTAKMDVATEYVKSPYVRPLLLGSSVYFLSEVTGSASLREYFVDDQALTNDAASVTSHVPTYLKGGNFSLQANSEADLVAVFSYLEPDNIALYKFFWGKDEKLQSAWFKWRFPGVTAVRGGGFFGNRLMLLLERAGGTYLEYIDVNPNFGTSGLPFLCHMDRLTPVQGVYDAVNDWTTWTLPYTESGDLMAVLGSGFSTKVGGQLTGITRPSSTTARFPGNYTAGPVWFGVRYLSRFTFSEQFAKNPKGGSSLVGKVMLKRMSLAYTESGYFRAEVTPKYRDTYTYPFTGKVLGDTHLLIGSPALSTGTFKFPVQSNAKSVTIDLINDSYLPCRFQSAEWEAEFIQKAQPQ